MKIILIKGESMKNIFVILFCLVLFGCATQKTTKSFIPTKIIYKPTKDIIVITNPTGAVIEVNNVYYGKSPVEVSFKKNSWNLFGNAIIVANPVKDGQYVQRKNIDLDSIPDNSKIYFNMNLIPASKEYDININK